MRADGLQGARRGKAFRTTRPDGQAVRPPDLVQREFRASRPNELWVVDFTYVPTWAGMAFTAFVTDVYSRRIVGWRTASSMPTELPLDALEMALWTRERAGEHVDGLVHHSDAGSQGELNWSSQHLDDGGVFDGDDEGAAAAGAAVSGADPVARGADGRMARGSCPVLDSDRSRREDRRCCSRGGRVIPGRVSVVSARWRREPLPSCGGVGPLPVVLRT